jgi:hypothetical protein
MKIESINDTLRDLSDSPTAVRVEGSFIILSYGLVDVYFNDSGRQVFVVTTDIPAPVTTPRDFWQRLVAAWNLILNKEQQ